MSRKIVDVLIIGAGPSGTVAAAYLQQKGVNVIVVEKSKFPRFVIGESLLPRSMEHFEEVGLIDCLERQNFEKKRGARFLRGDEVCNFDFSRKFTAGWGWTWQVPRADFDKALADEIQRRGVEILFKNEVVDVVFSDEGHSTTTIKNQQNETFTIDAKYLIDGSGYGRVLPRILGLNKASELPKHSSIFTHVKDIRRPEGREGTLITFDVVKPDVWMWVIPFSNGYTSIGFVGTTEFIKSYKGTNKQVLDEMLCLSKHYQQRFQGLDYEFTPKLIQNFSKSVKQLYGKGYVLTGNSTEFLDPVFSSGVAFATESSLLAAKLVHRELEGDNVNWEQEYSDYIKRGVAVFTSYVKEWYTTNLQTVFFHRPENLEVKKKICAVLAGYVWDETNPFVKKHDRAIRSMAHLLKMGE